jgi:hypothetical protein
MKTSLAKAKVFGRGLQGETKGRPKKAPLARPLKKRPGPEDKKPRRANLKTANASRERQKRGANQTLSKAPFWPTRKVKNTFFLF